MSFLWVIFSFLKISQICPCETSKHFAHPAPVDVRNDLKKEDLLEIERDW